MKKTRLTAAVVGATVLAAGLVACSGPASDADIVAQWPNNCGTIQIFLATSAGGASDLTYRAMAEEMSQELGVKVEVINAPGGGGLTALNRTKQAKADGCTLDNPTIPDSLAYIIEGAPADWTKEDFKLVGAFAKGPQVLVVNAESDYQTLDDLIAAGKAEGRLLSAADMPNGGDAVTNALLAEAAGVKISQVIVDGSPEKVQAVLSNQVQYETGAYAGVRAGIDNNQLRALAVWTDERLPFLPNVPTGKEQGVDVVIATELGLGFVPAVPDEIRQKMEDALKAVSEKDSFLEKLNTIGTLLNFQTGAEFSKSWDDRITVMGSIDFTTLAQ
ncbi:MAG: tripartite tricarboxylate transporter substrate binding protein [Propionibacteriaceae bacterium]|jgi:tripartite-type tricarboxylate transporter receptor subunit TctC|nr:tripartite tricarboxylate transporter substrate binding protein [Propionibacteriaceae bacterium]